MPDWKTGQPIRVESVGDETSAQVGCAISPVTGDVIVVLRLGDAVVAMTPAAARHVSDALAAEAVIAETMRA